MESNKTIRIFNGATAIVTGGASGIGRALAEELAKRGCEVVLADLQIELAEEVASEIHVSGGKAKAVKIDVTDFPAMEHLVQETVKRTGRLDYIFNNAGIVIGGYVNHLGIEDWNQIVNVNLRGVINGIQATYPIMMTQGFGHIINTASMAGLMVGPGNVALYNDQVCGGWSFEIATGRSRTDGNPCKCLMPWRYSHPYFRGRREIRQNAYRHSSRRTTANVGKIKAHVPKSICKKGAEISCKE